jgi:hypothetical protein
MSIKAPNSVNALLFKRRHLLEDLLPSGSGTFPFLGDSLGSSSFTSVKSINFSANIAEIMWHSNMVNFNCLNYKINRIFKELINTCTWF